MSKRVAVLMGGWSAEREVSLVSGAAATDALGKLGYHATAIDVGRDIAARLTDMRPYTDVVFNALHGRYGEDGCVQGMCELLKLPYTHSGVLASALAMDKPMAKRLFAASGIPVAEGRVVGRDELLDQDPMPRPYVIKPLNEGSSVGVRIVPEGDNRAPLADAAWAYGEAVLVEAYVPGHEITVAVMGERALGALEIRPRGDFYDYDAKYVEGRAEHLMPAPMPAADYDDALRLARLAHDALGCRGVTRADFRYDDEGGLGLRLLEVNTQPGLTPISLVPEIAAHAGIDFPALVEWMVENARCED
jgi:D-alanine-D-alanine ligase